MCLDSFGNVDSRSAATGERPTGASTLLVDTPERARLCDAATSDGTPARATPHTTSRHADPAATTRPSPPARPLASCPQDSRPQATQHLLQELHALLGNETLERYFMGQARIDARAASQDVSAPPDTLVITVATGLNAQILERRFGPVLLRVAEKVLGGEATSGPRVRFVVDRSAFVATATDQPAALGERCPSQPAPASAGLSRSPARNAVGLSTLGRYRLDDFLVGASNRLAVAAVRQLMETVPGRIASPAGERGGGGGGVARPTQGLTHVFLHGGCGLGKTHLLQGAARLFQQHRPGARVRYVTGEQFTNEFLTALRTGKIDAFRSTYRGVDLLCIDDVHFLANKDATQEELLHTLDAVGLGGARVLIASDAHPHHIAKLSQKLVGRFLSSAVVRIDVPDPALRRQLVKQLSARRGMLLAPEAVELLAQRSERAMGAMGGFGGSVREIEGLINQVDAVSRLLDTCNVNHHSATNAGSSELSASDIRRALGIDERAALARASQQASSGMPARPVSVKAIIEHVCEALCVEPADFRGKGRHKRVVFARSIVSHLARELTTQSFPEIARAMGRDNHSTIITAQRRLVQMLATTGNEVVHAELAPMHPGCTLRELVHNFTEESRARGRESR
jgi:chromosomal replication initiator protein